jgi:hypothetical protein
MQSSLDLIILRAFLRVIGLADSKQALSHPAT